MSPLDAERHPRPDPVPAAAAGDRVNRDVERTARTLVAEATELHDAIVAGALHRMAEHENRPARSGGDLARHHRTELARSTTRAVALVRRTLQLAALYPAPEAGDDGDRAALGRVEEA